MMLFEETPEQFINDHPQLDLGDLNVYRLVHVDAEFTITEFNYPVPPNPPRSLGSLGNGFTATLRLGPNGSLTLVRYCFPDHLSPAFVQKVGARIRGDFFLECATCSIGPRSYVPFRKGKLCEPIRFEQESTEPSGL